MSNNKEQDFNSLLNQGWQKHESEPNAVYDSMASILGNVDSQQVE